MSDPRHDLTCNHSGCLIANFYNTGYCTYHLAERFLKAGNKLLECAEDAKFYDCGEWMLPVNDDLIDAASELGITLDCECGKSHRGDCPENYDNEDRKAEAYEDDR